MYNSFAMLATTARGQWPWDNGGTLALWVVFGSLLMSYILQRWLYIFTTPQSRNFSVIYWRHVHSFSSASPPPRRWPVAFASSTLSPGTPNSRRKTTPPSSPFVFSLSLPSTSLQHWQSVTFSHTFSTIYRCTSAVVCCQFWAVACLRGISRLARHRHHNPTPYI
ncbi:hypothetical protein GGI35DRAFT_437093 [Trichoderma velutinum]